MRTPATALSTDRLAQQADAHWAGKLPGLDVSTQGLSFPGMYAVLYRHYSGTAHPSFRGLNVVIEDLDATRRRVVLERPDTGHQPYRLAAVIYGLGLYVTAASVGWPRTEDVNRAFAHYPIPE